jgi:hypothetical protein
LHVDSLRNAGKLLQKAGKLLEDVCNALAGKSIEFAICAANIERGRLIKLTASLSILQEKP